MSDNKPSVSFLSTIQGSLNSFKQFIMSDRSRRELETIDFLNQLSQDSIDPTIQQVYKKANSILIR